MAKKIVSVGLAEDILRILDNAAKELGLSRSATLERIILEKHLRKNQPTISNEPKANIEVEEKKDDISLMLEGAMDDAFKELKKKR